MVPTLALGADGFFQRGDAYFLPVGVNYAVADGARADEIRADFAAMAALGLNAVRVRSTAEQAAIARAGDQGLAVLCDEADFVVGVELLNFSARPGTHVLGFDGLTDPFFHTFLPFAVQWARLRRPVVASLGVGAALGARALATWLRAALPAAQAAGAAGFFWSELRGPDGLLDADGRVSPGREAFCALAGAAPPADATADGVVGLFVPAGGVADAASRRRLLLAQYFLERIGRGVRLVARGGALRTLLIAGVPVSPTDVAELRAWVAGGGELFWHGPDPLAWTEDVAVLLGARPADWRSGRGISVNAFGERFTLAHFPHDVRTELELCGASVLAADQQGFSLLLENRVGRGRVRYALPVVEESIAPVAAYPASRDRWAAWYRGLLAT